MQGSEIVDFRKGTGMTQKAFADFFGLPIRTLQEWEQGRREPPDYTIKMMARIWRDEMTPE